MAALQLGALVAALASTAAAHGQVHGIVAGGAWWQGYDSSFQYQNPPPTVIGWSIPEDQDNGFVAPSAYSNADIICHKGATNAGTHATVAAGSQVELQWSTWPESHKGPVIDYLANCNGACETADKTTLEFFKIDGVGLIDDATVPGNWASDQLIANNNSWVVTIPPTIAPGNYVLRHEIIALHSAGSLDGAQNYPQCINIEVTGSGSDKPAGVLGTALYKDTDAGISINIYQSLSTYAIPGPTLYSGAVSATQTAIPTTGVASTPSVATSAAAASTSVAVSTSAVASSSAAASSAVSSAAATSAAATSSVSSVAAVVTSAPSVSSVAAAGTSTATVDETDVATTEVIVTMTGAPSAAPVVSSAAAAVSDLTTAIPSSFLTAALPTAIPTASNHTGNGTGMPSKGLPEGFTLKDLLEWLEYLMSTMFRDRKHQNHARSMAHVKRQFQGFPSGGFAAPSGGFAAPSGRHHEHGHHGHAHHTGSFAKPTGIKEGFAMPTGFKHGGHHHHPTGGFPHPTGGFPRPTGFAGAF